MPQRVRLVHRVLAGRYHVYTSPDLDGIHASHETEAEAQRAAIAIVDYIAEREGAQRPVVAFVEELALQAA